MSKTKKTTEETTVEKNLDETVQVKEAKVEEAKVEEDETVAENVKDDKPVKEVRNVEDLKAPTDGVASGTMIMNVQHDGKDYKEGDKAPTELVQLFRSKGFCK